MKNLRRLRRQKCGNTNGDDLSRSPDIEANMIEKIISVTSAIDNSSGNYYDYKTVREIIHRFLTRDRIVLKPTKVKAYTVEELAKDLDIPLMQVRNLRTISRSAWKVLAPKLNLTLVELYCKTKFYEPDEKPLEYV